MRIARFAVPATIAALIPPILCLAQSQPAENATGSASGRVLLAQNLAPDLAPARAQDGPPIRHARVEFLNPSTGWSSSMLTDKNGNFQFASLSPAEYRVTVTAPACERLETVVMVEATAPPLLFQLRLAAQPPVPINDGAVSVQELRMSGKADSAFEKGVRLLQKGDLHGSLVYFQRVLVKDPGYYRAYHNLGLAYVRLGEMARAEEDFQKSIDLTNGGYAPSQFALAMVLCQRQQFQQAERLIQNGLAMDPGSALGKYFLGLVQFALNQPAEAEKSAREALWRSANQADAHILLARILEASHNPRAAMAEVAAYLNLDPHGPLESEATELRIRAQHELDQQPLANP